MVQPSQRSKFHGNQQNYQHKYLFIPNSILDKKVPQYLWPSKSPISKSTNFSNDVQHEIPKFFITFMQISTKTVNSQVHSNQIPDYYLLQTPQLISCPQRHIITIPSNFLMQYNDTSSSLITPLLNSVKCRSGLISIISNI